MQLAFHGSLELPVPRPVVWTRVLDPHFVKRCIRQAESVHLTEPFRYRLVTVFGAGLLRVRLVLDVQLSSLRAPEYATLTMAGRAMGSEVQIGSTVRLEEAGTGTRLDWTADAAVRGRVAGAGAHLVAGTARRLTEDFWREFARQSLAPGGGRDGP